MKTLVTILKAWQAFLNAPWRVISLAVDGYYLIEYSEEPADLKGFPSAVKVESKMIKAPGNNILVSLDVIGIRIR